jgi:uncharacterized cupin superfamily protein
MTDVTIKRIDDMEAVFDGQILRARAELGVTSFGMQVVRLPANWEQYLEHAHDERLPASRDAANVGQEEVYIPLDGTATLLVDGEEHRLEPGMMVRIGPTSVRHVVTGDEPFEMLAVGGVPGAVYEPPAFTELGAPIRATVEA